MPDHATIIHEIAAIIVRTALFSILIGFALAVCVIAAELTMWGHLRVPLYTYPVATSISVFLTALILGGGFD